MKQIELTVVSRNEKEVTFFISKQTRIGERFGRRCDALVSGKEFRASNGIILRSEFVPEVSFCRCLFYVRGEDKKRHKDLLTTTVSHFEEYQLAVNEYNEYFKGKQK